MEPSVTSLLEVGQWLQIASVPLVIFSTIHAHGDLTCSEVTRSTIHNTGLSLQRMMRLTCVSYVCLSPCFPSYAFFAHLLAIEFTALQTTKSDAFYIISLTYPTNGTIRTSLPLPVKDGDIVTFLGNTTTTTNSSTNSTTINERGEEKKGVEWHWTGEGVFELFADEEALKKVANAWAFKIEYK